MLDLMFRRRKPPLALLLSAVLVLSTHFVLSTIPRFLSFLPFLAMLPVAAVVTVAMMGVGRVLKRAAGVRASAPAAVVFNVVFVWGVYVKVLRPAISKASDALFHLQCALLLIGLYRRIALQIRMYPPSIGIVHILTRDPGFVTGSSSHQEGVYFSARIRQCRSCKASIKGFDHHCPAFGNCIGQKNHLLFLILLTGFAIAEATYTMLSFQYVAVFNTNNAWLEETLSGNFVVSTMLFSLLQLLWQVLFLIWHFYCICYNIKTDEWVNWNKYPEFQMITQEHPGELPEIRFRNPYDKGIIGNIKDFLSST